MLTTTTPTTTTTTTTTTDECSLDEIVRLEEARRQAAEAVWLAAKHLNGVRFSKGRSTTEADELCAYAVVEELRQARFDAEEALKQGLERRRRTRLLLLSQAEEKAAVQEGV
jgi:hypothetical protein